MTQLQSNAAALGIKLNLQPKPFNQVTALAAGNCVVAKIPCNWDMANWGGGWSFAPDFLPTGETLFKCGAIANSGGYCDTNNDALINATLTSNSDQAAVQLAGLPGAAAADGCGSPTPTTTSTRSPTTCTASGHMSPTLTFTPEDWYFVK